MSLDNVHYARVTLNGKTKTLPRKRVRDGRPEFQLDIYNHLFYYRWWRVHMETGPRVIEDGRLHPVSVENIWLKNLDSELASIEDIGGDVGAQIRTVGTQKEVVILKFSHDEPDDESEHLSGTFPRVESFNYNSGTSEELSKVSARNEDDEYEQHSFPRVVTYNSNSGISKHPSRASSQSANSRLSAHSESEHFSPSQSDGSQERSTVNSDLADENNTFPVVVHKPSPREPAGSDRSKVSPSEPSPRESADSNRSDENHTFPIVSHSKPSPRQPAGLSTFLSNVSNDSVPAVDARSPEDVHAENIQAPEESLAGSRSIEPEAAQILRSLEEWEKRGQLVKVYTEGSNAGSRSMEPDEKNDRSLEEGDTKSQQIGGHVEGLAIPAESNIRSTAEEEDVGRGVRLVDTDAQSISDAQSSRPFLERNGHSSGAPANNTPRDIYNQQSRSPLETDLQSTPRKIDAQSRRASVDSDDHSRRASVDSDAQSRRASIDSDAQSIRVRADSYNESSVHSSGTMIIRPDDSFRSLSDLGHNEEKEQPKVLEDPLPENSEQRSSVQSHQETHDRAEDEKDPAFVVDPPSEDDLKHERDPFLEVPVRESSRSPSSSVLIPPPVPDTVATPVQPPSLTDVSGAPGSPPSIPNIPPPPERYVESPRMSNKETPIASINDSDDDQGEKKEVWTDWSKVFPAAPDPEEIRGDFKSPEQLQREFDRLREQQLEKNNVIEK